MSTTRRKLSVFTLVVVSVLSFAGFVSAQTTITYYMATGQDDWVAWTRETVNRFEKLYPDIKVEVLSGNMENLFVMVASGIYPDVIHMDGGTLPEYAELNLLKPLDELVAEDTSFNLDDYFPALIDSMRWKGELYALPRAWGAVALVYNRDLIEMAGASYPD